MVRPTYWRRPSASYLPSSSVRMWYRFDLSPVWVPGNPTRPDRLIWDTHSDTAHDHVVELLTRSAARIPGAVHRPSTPCSGTIQLGSGSAQLISNG
ncbi:hypothetical protein [Streptomyces sp. NRRL S-1314]|nr:hypothetical protein [Streptomyces sp. NRRL S-1314]